MSTLFDCVKRTYTGPAAHAEDTFTFLNRSARAPSANVRLVLEDWFNRYPENEQESLRSRFRTEFSSAFFELFIHELLVRLGCSVIVHPALTEVSKRPDFMATFPSGFTVVVEAVLATDQSDEEIALEARWATLYDEINNKVESPNFFLRLSHVQSPSALPAPRKIRAFIERCLSGLDPDAVAQEMEGHGLAGPRWTFREGDFSMEISVIPKSPEERGNQKLRNIGIYPFQSRWGGTDAALRNSVMRKATRYGRIGLPFVIAVNAISQWGTDQIEIMEALFGSEEFFDFLGEADLQMHRKPNGVWRGPSGPQNTRLSAVLVCQVNPWNLANAPIRLYHNPFATYPCIDHPWQVPEAIPDIGAGKMKLVDGLNSGKLLQVLDGWPRDEAMKLNGDGDTNPRN